MRFAYVVALHCVGVGARELSEMRCVVSPFGLRIASLRLAVLVKHFSKLNLCNQHGCVLLHVLVCASALGIFMPNITENARQDKRLWHQACSRCFTRTHVRRPDQTISGAEILGRKSQTLSHDCCKQALL